MSFFNYLFIHKKLNIKRKDIVLEIGPGGDPFLRSDILVEKYIDDDTERYSNLVFDRMMIAADGIALPFKDKTIDFIFCSQVLEHILEPIRFLNELSRVGKRGIIITPHSDYEIVHPKKGHLWYIWNDTDLLYLKQKISWDEHPENSDYYRKITRLPGYWKFYNKNHSFFNTEYLWEGKINYRIEKHENFNLSKFKKCGEHNYIDKPFR